MKLCTVPWSELTPRDRVRHLELEGIDVLPGLLSPEREAAMKAELARLPIVATDYSENQRSCKDVPWIGSRTVCVSVTADTRSDTPCSSPGDWSRRASQSSRRIWAR